MAAPPAPPGVWNQPWRRRSGVKKYAPCWPRATPRLPFEFMPRPNTRSAALFSRSCTATSFDSDSLPIGFVPSQTMIRPAGAAAPSPNAILPRSTDAAMKVVSDMPIFSGIHFPA